MKKCKCGCHTDEESGICITCQKNKLLGNKIVGTCKKCGNNRLDIKEGSYTCKECKHVGNIKEWL